MASSELRRLSELRSLLEGFAARHAARHAAESPGELKRIGGALQNLTRALRASNYDAFREADLTLHETLIKMARVPGLDTVWRLVWEGLLDFHEQGFEDYFPDVRVLIQEHEHLVETIALGDPVAAEDAARSHVEAVWFRVAEKSKSGADPGSGALYKATAHVAFRLHCPLRLSEVANQVAFTSAGNLSRLFRKHHGVGFQAYLQRLRMEKAAELLRTTRLSVARVARRVGYRDVSRFGQHFRRHHGKTPRRWRVHPDGTEE